MPVVEHRVFVYGSLMSPRSAALTIGREPELVPAVLDGWERRWNGLTDNASERRYLCLACGGAPRWVVCLNCERRAGGRCAGALLGVTAEEIAALDRRERRYDRIPLAGDDDVPLWIYARRPEHTLDRLPPARSRCCPAPTSSWSEPATRE